MAEGLESQVADIVGRIEDLASQQERRILFDNAKIKDALTEQPRLSYEWSWVYSKAKALLELCELNSGEAFSHASKNVIKNSHYKLTSTELKYFVESDPTYIEAKKLEIKMRRAKDLASSVRETIDSRKFVLNNLAKLVVAGTEDHIL